jgi:2-dehydropantoate 2-reductase
MIAVVGMGGIGSVMAASLRAADRHDVLACARQPLDRLVLERPERTVEVALRCLIDPAQAAPVDWVFLATKAHQTPACADWLARLCRPDTRIVVLQNGIDHGRRVGPFAPGARVVPTVVYYNGERLDAARVRFRHVTDHELAAPDDADGRALAELLAGTSLGVLLSADFATLSWRKLLINAVANPITALTLQRQTVLRRDDMLALCRAVLEEAVAVARADGVALAPDEVDATLATLLTYPAEAGTSMLFDRMAGRALEIEALTGAIVGAGERHGVATPLNRALLTLLRAVSETPRAVDQPA